MSIAVVLNAHENSPVLRDTLDSVSHHWTRDVLVVADAKNWDQFSGIDLGVRKLEGFYHGRPSAPFRNVCLGLMKAWEAWGDSKVWYCYLEYDCLVGSSDTLAHLDDADSQGIWILGNDLRFDSRSIPFMDRFNKGRLELRYLLGCCLFFSRNFMSALARSSFFDRFLNFTNFNTDAPVFVSRGGKQEEVYDLSEFLYPTLAHSMGGRVAELACWEGSRWRGEGLRYPMRFRPDLDEGEFPEACVMHPLKSYDSSARRFHRSRRSLTSKP